VAYLDLDLTLFSYKALKDVESGQIDLLLEAVDVEQAEGPGISMHSVEDLVEYVRAEDVQQAVSKAIATLTDHGHTVRPHKAGRGNWMEIRKDSNAVGYLQTRQSYVNCQYWSAKDDMYITIKKLTSFVELEEKWLPLVLDTE
jgi:hypothetical protein